MSFAFRLYDYRLFCTGCKQKCDVRAIDTSDAERESQAAGWRMVDGEGMTCPICIEFNKRDRSRKIPSSTNFQETHP